MPKVVACIIARTVSQRLPLKVLRDFRPHLSMLDFLIQYVKTQKVIDEVYLCTSKESVDDILEDVALRNNIKIYRGSPDEVIERMLTVGTIENADILIRITGDNPFTAAELIDEQVQFLLKEKLDYVRVTDLPVGATAEVFTLDALKHCNELMDPKVSEYLMLYLFEPNNFKCGVIKAYEKDYSAYSLTVDNPDDFIRTKIILDRLEFERNVSLINLSAILTIISDVTIELPARIITPSGEVKLPFNKVIPFQEFKMDMDRRFNNSKFLKLYE
jgi:spore coat polysaccharide biosynthesis protein SpsF